MSTQIEGIEGGTASRFTATGSLPARFESLPGQQSAVHVPLEQYWQAELREKEIRNSDWSRKNHPVHEQRREKSSAAFAVQSRPPVQHGGGAQT